MRSSVHADNSKKDILILDKFPTQGFDNTTLTAVKEYSIIILVSNIKSFVYVCIIIGWKVIYLLIVLKSTNSNDSDINAAPLCLGNVLKDFSVDNMKNIGLCWCAYDFPVDYDSIDVADILDIYKYLMWKRV